MKFVTGVGNRTFGLAALCRKGCLCLSSAKMKHVYLLMPVEVVLSAKCSYFQLMSHRVGSTGECHGL